MCQVKRNYVFADRITNINVKDMVEEANIILNTLKLARIGNNHTIDTASAQRKKAFEDCDYRSLIIWTIVEAQAFENQVKLEDPQNVFNDATNGGF